MFFASDNSGPVHPQVMDALAEANSGFTMAYGADPLMDEVRTRLREVFEAPDAAIYLVATGTAANSLALATMCQPYETVFCSPTAHIHEDECNAPEFYSGGAKLTLVAGSDKMTPDALRGAIAGEETRGVHGPQRGPVSITQVTERGSVYTLDELNALTATAREFDLRVHLDGARFANAMVALGCTPAEMSWKAGVDVLSFESSNLGMLEVDLLLEQGLVEEALTQAISGDLGAFHRMMTVLERPFEVQDGAGRYAEPAPADAAPYVTFCGT